VLGVHQLREGDARSAHGFGGLRIGHNNADCAMSLPCRLYTVSVDRDTCHAEQVMHASGHFG
jgi:hypothetical protein